jgi:hypothetical protein
VPSDKTLQYRAVMVGTNTQNRGGLFTWGTPTRQFE